MVKMKGVVMGDIDESKKYRSFISTEELIDMTGFIHATYFDSYFEVGRVIYADLLDIDFHSNIVGEENLIKEYFRYGVNLRNTGMNTSLFHILTESAYDLILKKLSGEKLKTYIFKLNFYKKVLHLIYNGAHMEYVHLVKYMLPYYTEIYELEQKLIG